MHPTLTEMLSQAHRHELDVEAARVRLAAIAKPARAQRRHTNIFPSAIAIAVILLATATLLVACGGPGTTVARLAMPGDGSHDAAQLFESACASCHGPFGEGGPSGVPLNGTSVSDPQMVVGAIRYGIGAMPASSAGMSDEQIRALAAYVAGLR